MKEVWRTVSFLTTVLWVNGGRRSLQFVRQTSSAHAALSVRKRGQNGFWFGLEIHLSFGTCACLLLLLGFPVQHQ